MTQFKIYPISTGRFEEAETSFLYYMGSDENYGVKTPAVYWMFLIKGPDILILVDNGPADPDESAITYHHPYDRQPSEEPIAALEARGFKATDIDIVVNTHLHWDHCYSNHLFPNATIRIQASEIVEALDPVPAHRALYTPAIANPPWIRALPQTKPVHGDEELTPGVTLLHLPSHTIGSQGVLVETAVGQVLIAGDVLPFFDNWTGRWGFDHIPSGAFQSSIHDYYACFRRIEELDAAVVLPGVDPRVGEQESYG